MKKCVFFDRDGVINESPGSGYVLGWDDFHVIPEFIDTLKLVAEKGYVSVVITNQRCVAKGLITKEALEDMHNRLQALLKEKHGLEFLDIFYCPHDRNECDCRKPLPGMLLSAAKKHDIDLSASWMIGDSEKDVQAGKSAGCKTVLVSGDSGGTEADFRVGSMKDLAGLLCKEL